MRTLPLHPPTTLPPLPLGAPARSVAVLADLRAETRTLGMAIPDAPVKLRHPAPVRLRPEALALRSLDRLVATAAVYDHVADEVETALAELAELAPFTAKAGC